MTWYLRDCCAAVSRWSTRPSAGTWPGSSCSGSRRRGAIGRAGRVRAGLPHRDRHVRDGHLGAGEDRQRRALRLIAAAFTLLAVYLAVQSSVVLAAGFRPPHSRAGIAWTAVTAEVMFGLAAGKAHTGKSLDNPVLRTEGRVNLVDAVLADLALNAGLGWWQADPLAGYVLVCYAARSRLARPRLVIGSPGMRPW